MNGPGRVRRFRMAILFGCLLMIGSGFLPWWQTGGDALDGVRLPAWSGIGLDGPGMVIFGGALVALLVLDLGYIRGRWGFVLDAPVIYLSIGLLAAGAVVYRGWQLWSVAYVPLPQTSPGLVLAVVGVALVLYGAGTGFGAHRPV